ncbi:hypothetical protein [Sphingobacterium sp.]|uniref:hypothetical protein n=1 Tax=Sphingobacterium sp. TaxID=341027 RepID=UPI00289F62AC|nr:hypothetical protein [Sphingobacterium sp.]
MKRLIYLFYAIACAGSVKGQDLKSVHPVFIEINSKNPDKAVFGDDQISIKFLDIKSDLLKLEFENRTDRNIEFVRKKSYTLIDGTANDTYIGYERDNAATYQKNDLIPKSSKITSILFPGSFFGL